MQFPRMPLRKTYFIIIIALTLLIAIASGFNIYRGWIQYGDRPALIIWIFIFICGLLLSFYSWYIVALKILRPMDSIIDTLYKESSIKPADPLQIDPSLDEVEKLARVLKIFQDNASKIKQVAESLRVRENYLKSILAAAIDVVITIDKNGIIQTANPAIEETLGYTEADLIGKNVNILMTEPDRSRHDSYINRYLETGESKILNKHREVEVLRKDGTIIPIELSATEMKSDGHHVFIGVFHDISQRKQAEAEREKYLRDLEISNRELDDFSYIVSHDLKEPLRGLQSFSRFLLEDYEDKLDEEGKNKLHIISDLTQRLEELLDALLHYSRLGRTALATRETDLNEVVQNVISMFSITMEETSTAVEISQQLPVVICDHVRITEVFQNLIGNALKYNDKKENKIVIGYVTNHERAPGKVVFYVKDNGIGIAEKHLKSIFKIFKRLHPRGAYGGGTGSGLSIVKKIINQHGGQVWAESKGEGHGSTFFFTLPQPRK